MGDITDTTQRGSNAGLSDELAERAADTPFSMPRDEVGELQAALRDAEDRSRREQAERERLIEQMQQANEQLVLTSLNIESLRERLSAALDASGTGTFRWDAEADSLECDHNLLRLFGRTDDVNRCKLNELFERVHPEDRALVMARWLACAEGGQDIDIDFRTVWPDESVHWISSHGRLPSGAESVFGACVDISDQKRAAEERTAFLAARETERRYRLLTDAMPQLVWIARPDGHLDYGNQRWFEYIGLTLGTSGGMRFEIPLHVEDRQRVLDDWKRATELGAPLQSQARLRRGDGTYRWFLIRAIPMLDAGEQVSKWFGTCTDIEDQKRVEEDASRASNAKDEFLAMLAHELRNPLSPIVTAVHLMKHKGDTSTARERAIIERQVNYLVRLVDDLLDVARLTRGQVEVSKIPLSLVKVVDSAVEIASTHITQRGHHLQIAVADDLEVEGDPTRLAQVVANLLNNAAKYTPSGGHITVSATRQDADVELSIRDDGVGIPGDLLPRMFDMFVQGSRTLARSEGGLGIGLTVVKRLVELHGGTIEVASPGNGAGSVFTLRLPALSGARRETTAHEAESPGVTPAHRVLVVDDNADSADLIVELLREHGHVVAVSYDGEAAVRLAATFRPDTMLVDIGLPIVDGYQVAKAVRSSFGDRCPRLIAVSGYGQLSDRVRTHEAGFDAHLVKPVGPEKLLALVNERAHVA